MYIFFIFLTSFLPSIHPFFLSCFLHSFFFSSLMLHHNINHSIFRFSLIEAFESSALIPEHDATLYPIFRLVLQLCYDEGQYSTLLISVLSVLNVSASTTSDLFLLFLSLSLSLFLFLIRDFFLYERMN